MLNFEVLVYQELDDPYPTLKLTYSPYNACSIPAEHLIEWEPGRAMVEVYELVGDPEKGCPTRSTPNVHQYVPLDAFTDGDEIYVNGELQFKLISYAFCYDFTYGNCPSDCVSQCTSSVCSGSACTADCDGPNSCLPPNWDLRPYQPDIHQPNVHQPNIRIGADPPQ